MSEPIILQDFYSLKRTISKKLSNCSMADHYAALKGWGSGTMGWFFGVPGRGKGALKGPFLVT